VLALPGTGLNCSSYSVDFAILLSSRYKIEERIGKHHESNSSLHNKPFDADEWQKLYYRNQQQYIRQRLVAVKLLHEGHNRTQVSQQLGCCYDTLTTWIDKYLSDGLIGVVTPIRHQKPSRLTPEQQQQLNAMVLTQRPTNYGDDRHLWSGTILSEVIEQRFKVKLKDSRIYELLSELGLSYQRAHRDYANADPRAQKEWVETVKKTAIAATE
jgi:transposase